MVLPLCGFTTVYGSTIVSGFTTVYGFTIVSGFTIVCGVTRVAVWLGLSSVFGSSDVRVCLVDDSSGVCM